MLEFIDTRPFGAACIGLATMATGYVADASNWFLIALPPLLMFTYYLFFSDGQEIERSDKEGSPPSPH
jgi:hypothetical protein